MMHTTARSLFLCALLLVVTGIGVGQVATGTPPFGSFGGGPFDTVDLGNLNVHFAISIVHKPGRGTPFNYDLSYDSSVWYPVGSSGNQNWQPVYNWGWRAQTEMTAGYVTYSSYPEHCLISGHSIPYTAYLNWAFHDPWGVVHPFGSIHLSTLGPTCGVASQTSTTTDGSGYSMTATYNSSSRTLSATVFPRGGGSQTPPLQTGSGAASVTDANGNQISVSPTGVFTDTLGTTVPVLTVSGTGTPSSPTVFTYTGPNGSVPVRVHYANQTVRTYFRCSGITDYGPIANTPLVSDVTFNDGSQYLFQYEQSNDPSSPGSVTGRVSQVTLPTGGIIQYQYSGGTNGINCVDGSAATMTRTLTPGGPWTYVHSQVSGSEWKTTVTTPPDPQNQNSVGDDTVLYFQGIYETQRLAYQGSASGTPLQTVVTCYNNNSTNCNTTAFTLPITRRTVTLQLPGGKQSKRDTFYDTTGYGLTTEIDEYGFDPTAPPLIRKTSTSYGSFSSGTCVALNNGIVDHPCIVKVTDSGGSTKAQTTYTYDQGTPASSGTTPQHISITGSRGNLTTLTMSASSSSTTSLSKTFTYYDTGTPNVARDVNGAQTTYVYGTAAQGNSTVSCGNSFATTINEPLSLSRSITWNCAGGVATLVTDENGNHVSSNYTDANFWRPANVYDQQNNETTISYLGQTAVETALVSFNGGKSVSDSRTTTDAFGRRILSQRLQGPTATNYDTAETDYDDLGQPSRTTMPFSAPGGSTSSTAPGATITHDALGRVLTITDADTGTVSYTYTDNDVLQKVSGTQTFQKQFEYDGLGRLTSVCEISATLPGIGICGQGTTPQPQGYWTKYTYDALGHLLTVTQNAQAATANQQARSFTYDWLGRMTSETNPETGNGASGTVTYSYDPYSFCWSAGADGNLHTRTDSAGNVTCYLHDALHRLTDASGWVNSTWRGPCRRFRYDASTNGVISPGTGWNLNNLAGHPVEVETDSCAAWPPTPITDEWLGYSPRGELTDAYESAPHSGGYYHTQASYWPTGALDSLGGIPSVPTLYYGASDGSGLDGEGRLTKVTAASGTNPVTGVTYDTSGTAEPLGALTKVTFGSADSDSFTYDPNTGRMKTYTFSMNSMTDKGTLTWNTNGTLQKLVIADLITGTSDSQTCNYLYDDLARLSSGGCGTSWTQNFTYDAFGNIQKSVPSGDGGGSFLPIYSTANPNNQFTSIPGVTTPYYDQSGNLIKDNLNTYTWDPNWGNMLAVNTGSAIVTATYDALGRMVENNAGGTYAEFIFGPTGAKLAQANGQTLVKAFIALPGGAKAIYSLSGLAYYRHSDWLGSSRLTSTATTPTSMYSSSAYAPFGEQYKTSGTADASFTGQNSDTVSSLYDFMFRESSPSQGRWISPDPAGMAAVSPGNPQSWNRYAYVANNPLAFVDLLGLQRCVPGVPGYIDDCPTPPDDPILELEAGGAGFRCGGGDAARCPGFNEHWWTFCEHNSRMASCAGFSSKAKAANNGTPQTPQQPSKLKNALNCVVTALPSQLQANTSQLGTNLKYSFTAGPAIGVGACTVIVISEPYLAPSWPGCSVLAATSTTAIMASGSVFNWFIGNMASTVGTVYYCSKNELGGS